MTMRFPILACLAACAVIAAGPAVAQLPDDEDDIVRLPGQGERKDQHPAMRERPERLVPGGGLILSFDANSDGRVTPDEVSSGLSLAFTIADSNTDGWLSALEQVAWAEQLPTRDETLSNPARFDPNLDRVIQFEEFASVVSQLAADYRDDASGDILVASLRASRPESDRRQLTRLVRDDRPPRPERR